MALLAVAAVGGGGFAWWSLNFEQQARRDAVAAQHTAEAQSRIAVGRSLAVTAPALAKENVGSEGIVGPIDGPGYLAIEEAGMPNETGER